MSIKPQKGKSNKPTIIGSPSPVHAVTGELTIAVAAEVKAKVATWLSGNRVITLDLSSVSRVDCAGLQVIIAAARTGRVTLRSISSAVHRAMEIVGHVPAELVKDS